jgi:hypothetical protein
MLFALEFLECVLGKSGVWRPSVDLLLAFEVMDKEWPLSLVLGGFLGLGVVGLLVCRKRPIWAVGLLPLVLLGGMRQIMELSDPYVGSAIRAEAGFSYVAISYGAIVASLILLGTGTVQGWKRRKQSIKS